jgi:glutaredoxin
MTDLTARPTLTIYRRPGCHLCDDAELLLRDELAQRARSGHGPIDVQHIDISADPELELRYRRLIPVFRIGHEESDLVTSERQIREFLERALPSPA